MRANTTVVLSMFALIISGEANGGGFRFNTDDCSKQYSYPEASAPAQVLSSICKFSNFTDNREYIHAYKMFAPEYTRKHQMGEFVVIMERTRAKSGGERPGGPIRSLSHISNRGDDLFEINLEVLGRKSGYMQTFVVRSSGEIEGFSIGPY